MPTAVPDAGGAAPEAIAPTPAIAPHPAAATMRSTRHVSGSIPHPARAISARYASPSALAMGSRRSTHRVAAPRKRVRASPDAPCTPTPGRGAPLRASERPRKALFQPLLRPPVSCALPAARHDAPASSPCAPAPSCGGCGRLPADASPAAARPVRGGANFLTITSYTAHATPPPNTSSTTTAIPDPVTSAPPLPARPADPYLRSSDVTACANARPTASRTAAAPSTAQPSGSVV